MTLGLAVVVMTLHLPVAEVELALRAAVQTRPIRAAVAGEGTAHLCMTATKHTRYQAADSSRRRAGIELGDCRIGDG